MQHFGYVVYFFWKSRCNEPPMREIRDSMGAIRSFWTIFCLGQNRGYYKLQCLNVHCMFKLSEYWTRARCNMVHLLQGKEVRSVYFVFVHTESLFLKTAIWRDHAILIFYPLRVRVHYFST